MVKKVYDEVYNFINNTLNTRGIEINEHVMMKDGLNMDSLDVVNLVVVMEDKFNVELFDRIESVEDASIGDFCKRVEALIMEGDATND